MPGSALPSAPAEGPSRVRARAAAGIGLALLATGALFGTPSLYPPGIALVMLPGLTLIWVLLSSRGVRLRRVAPGGTLIEGERAQLEIAIGGGPVPPPGGELRDPLLGTPAHFGPGGLELSRTVSFPRRGWRSLGTAEALVRDPLGLFERRIEGPPAPELLVLPRVEPVGFTGTGSAGRTLAGGRRGSGGAGPDSWAAEFEIDGLRSYREGTPASRIHWPTAARTGELHERRITAGAEAARLLVVDPRRPAGSGALDAAIRAAASLALELAKAGGCAVLIGGEGRALELDRGLRAWPKLHAALAVVEDDAGAPALHRIGRSGLVVWVSADPSRRVEAELRKVRASRRILVRPNPGSEGLGALFAVAGCSGRALGERARPAGGVAA